MSRLRKRLKIGIFNAEYRVMANQRSIICRWRRCLRIALDRLFDRYYGIDTTSSTMIHAREKGCFDDANVNGPVSYWLLAKYIDRNLMTQNDVFYDVGCGHGRVLSFVARRKLRKCVGVELSSDFAKMAEANAGTLRLRMSPIEIKVGDAVQMDYRDGDIFFFGDPFGYATLRAVLARIRQTLEVRPRRILCIFWIPLYVDPRVERVIQSTGWLTRLRQKKVFYSPMRAEYWGCAPSLPTSTDLRTNSGSLLHRQAVESAKPQVDF